ncbi:MAG: ABC transporter permease [Desulfurococcales archaeon]|nr:ABC transporter permease [Desulfurococcales archaeon]
MPSKILRAYTYALLAMIYVPIAFMVVMSFNDSPYAGEWKGFTVKWYKLLLADSRALEAFNNSLTIAIASAIVSTLIALPAAYHTSKTPKLGVLNALTAPPIVIPEITEAVSLLVLFLYIGFPLGWVSVFIAHTAFNAAYAYVTLTVIRGADENLVAAARTLGASRFYIWRRVIIPLSMPGIVASLMLTFMLSFTNFIKTLFTKGPGFETLPILIWNRARRPGLTELSSQNALNALTTLLVLVSISIATVYTVIVLRRSRTSRIVGA